MWFQINDQQVAIRVFAKPNAKQTRLIKITNEALHIALHAKAHEGEANRELVSCIAKLFRLPKSQVQLVKGMNSRHKVINVPLTNEVKKFISDA